MAESRDRPLLPGEARDMVKALGDAAVTMLSNQQLSQPEKTRRFRHLLNQSFALRGIARFALGRYWRRSDFAQRRRYLVLFEDYIVNSYAARFGNYSGESFIVVDESIDQRGWATVKTRIQRPGGEPVEVIWHLRERLGAVRIVDVVVEGISMSLTQRSDFAAAVRTAVPGAVIELGPGTEPWTTYTAPRGPLAGERLQHDTGFTVGHSLEAGILEFAEWMRAHPETYR